MMSNSKKIDDSPNDNDSSEDVFQNQEEDFDGIPTKTVVENLSPLGKLASESERLSSRTVKVSSQLSNQPPTISTQSPNIDQLEESTHVDPLREKLRSDKSHSRSADVVISSEQNPTTASVSVLQDSNNSGAKTNQRNLSPFAARRNADFASPPERGTAPVNKSLSKNLKETNTPSPEKRSMETDVELTPIKRLKKTPDSDSGKTGTETRSCRSELSLSAASKTSSKSPTYLLTQQIRTNEESESMSTPSNKKKRKARSGSVESKTVSGSCLSNVMSNSSAASVVQESTNSSEVAIQNLEESPSERKTSLSSEDCSTDSNSSSKHSSPDYSLITASFLNWLTEGNESAVSKKSTDASLANPNLETRKQKDAQSVSDALDEETPFNLTPEKPGIIMHLTSTANTSLLRPSDVSRKKRDRLLDAELSSEVFSPDSPIKEVEPVVHPLRLTDQTSSSNLGPLSESQNYTTEVSESGTEAKKVQNSASVSDKETESVSNETQSAIETPILRSSKSSLLILNPHLPSSCHLPQRDHILAPDVVRNVLGVVKSHKKVRIDQKPLNPSTQTSPPGTELGPQTKKSPVSRIRGIHERSFSDKTPTSRNSVKLSQSNILQGKFPRSYPKESSAASNIRMHRRSVSDGSLTSSKSTEVQAQQDQSNSLARTQPKDTPMSRYLAENSEDVDCKTCVVEPPSQRTLPISASNATSSTSGPFEFLYSGRSLSSNESATSRNNPVIQTQRDDNELSTSAASNPVPFWHSSQFNALLSRITETFPSSETSISINNPEILTQRHNNEPSTSVPSNPLSFWYSSQINALLSRITETLPSNELTTSRNPEIQTQRDGNELCISAAGDTLPFWHSSQFNALLSRITETFPSNETTSRNNPEMWTQRDGNEPSTSAASNPVPFWHSSQFNALLSRITETLPSNELTTSRNPEIPMQRDNNEPSTSAASNPVPFWHSSQFKALLSRIPETISSNEWPTSRNNPEIQTQRSGNDFWTSAVSNLLPFGHLCHFNASLPQIIETFLSNESTISRNNPIVPTQLNSVTPHQRTTPRFLSEVLRDIFLYINGSQGQASTSRIQPFITGGSSIDQSCLLASRNVATMAGIEINSSQNALGETSAVEQEPSTTDGSSSNDQLDSTDDSSSSDVSNTGDAPESTHRTFEPHTESLTEKHPEYLLQARQQLLSVLKELMLFEEQEIMWNLLEPLFLRLSENSSLIDRIKVVSELVHYLVRKASNLCITILMAFSHEMEEMLTIGFCGKLTFTLVNALIFTLTVSSTRDFTDFFQIYLELKLSWRTFFNSSFEEDPQYEPSRNRVKTMMALIHRLMLGTRLAFQRLLMYIGENISESTIELYECDLSEEDKKFLRRKFGDEF